MHAYTHTHTLHTQPGKLVHGVAKSDMTVYARMHTHTAWQAGPWGCKVRHD